VTSNYFGLDLTSGKQKASACVSIDNEPGIIKAALIFSDKDIITIIRKSQPEVVAIDAPLSLPEGLCCLDKQCPCKPLHEYKGRWSEQLLARAGFPCYFTTKKSIIKNMVIRSMKLKEELEKYKIKVIEVYPYASKTILFGKLKRKTTTAGISQLRETLDSLLRDSDSSISKWNHDLCDAAIAAYTGLLWYRNATKKLGNDSEGYIFIPDNSCGQEIDG
jgi:predicted nuclease with RNAse H fold